MIPVLRDLESGRPRPALAGPGRRLRTDELAGAVRETAAALGSNGIRRLALAADNGPEWIVADLAARLAGIVVVPLPSFFTSGQVTHVFRAAGVQGILTRAESVPGWSPAGALPCGLVLHARNCADAALPPGTAKITFTSGTTGEPRGVCLSGDCLDDVAASLAQATAALPLRRHLAVLPLPVLLENVAGVCAALLRGCEVLLPPLPALGWHGSSEIDVARLAEQIASSGANSVILLPQLLDSLVGHLEHTGKRLPELAFVAVGGGRTAPVLIERARGLGLPVFEGYGLSECGSVVCLNLPGADRPGTVGRPLPGRALRVGPEGRIQARCPGFLGYVGESARPSEWFDTGDLGSVDEAGHFRIDGRSKNVLITAYGRNVSPEWVESELAAEPGIRQAIVVGDGQPALGALIVAAEACDVAGAVRRCNDRLPDYARIRHWRRIEPLTAAGGMLTANGRVRRDRALIELGPVIDNMFTRQLPGVSPAP